MHYKIEPVAGPELFEVYEIRRLFDLFDVISVHKIINPLLWGLYNLRKKEMEYTCQNEVDELFLYHATSISNIDSIAEFNLDWRCTSRSRYGKGVNFSHCPIYANKYASYATVCDEVTIDVLTKMGFPKEAVKRAINLSYGSLENATKWLMEHIMDPNYAENSSINDDDPVERTFVLCYVLCQKVKEVGVSYNLKVVPNFYDTARSRNGNVWIKFNDFEFYPLYVIRYKERLTTNVDFSVDNF